VAVDVLTERIIDRPQEVVAAFTGDSSNAPRWYANIERVDLLTPPPLAVGSRMGLRARFLGRVLEYVDEIVDLEPGRRLVMRTEQGPFPMETIYEWHDAGPGRTRMTLRNRGEPVGFAPVAAPAMAAAARRATR